MTAGPTPLPPAVSQVMAEPMVYHRAPAFVEVYARVLERLKDVFQTANEVQVFTSSGTGALESAVANLVRPGEPVLVASCGKFGERWFELCEAYGAETIHWETEWGRKVDPPRSTSGSPRTRDRARLHHLLRDLDRRRERRPRAHRGRAPPRRADRRRRRVRPRRGAAAAGRLGRGRGGGRVAEGADGAARAGLRQRERGRARARRREPGPALLLRLGAHRRGPAPGPAGQPVHAGRGPRQGARRGARDDRGRGARAGLRAARPAGARHARGGEGARPRAARRRRGRERQRGDRDGPSRTRSTAARCRS